MALLRGGGGCCGTTLCNHKQFDAFCTAMKSCKPVLLSAFKQTNIIVYISPLSQAPHQCRYALCKNSIMFVLILIYTICCIQLKSVIFTL
ncbi:hypothetical protein XELAEV_18043700mg [Xenopus laevis]|uniref:Uncharacterized protein n=1 Tax=Xenopus laevis TaxID=8355 RepID=A0A974H2M0_XENLA|nr:hypothetical protein XELAEV_18043700mg [Xenopus laevis]